MEGATLKTRLVQLLQRSRRAVRLYSSVGRSYSSNDINEVTETQAREWQSVNTELLRRLAPIAEEHRAKELVRGVFAVRDWFFEELRTLERELWEKQRALCSAAENGDFARSLVLSRALVCLKARVQANQAVCHEIDQVIKQSRVNRPDGVDSSVLLSNAGSRQVQEGDARLDAGVSRKIQHGSHPNPPGITVTTGIAESASPSDGSKQRITADRNAITRVDNRSNYGDSIAVGATDSNKDASLFAGQDLFEGSRSKVIPLKRRR